MFRRSRFNALARLTVIVITRADHEGRTYRDLNRALALGSWLPDYSGQLTMRRGWALW